jgi:hypothetical protein
MSRIKSILISAFIMVTCIFCYSCQNKNNALVLKSTLRGSYFFKCTNYLPEGCDSLEYYLLDVELINNSKNKIEFLTNYNTPIRNVILTSNEFKIVGNHYINDGLFTIELNPGKGITFPLFLVANRKIHKKIIIGWAYLTYENTVSIDNYLHVLEKARTEYKNVIWSDSIYLDERVAKPIEVR